jgi:hypothetical protein
MQQNAKIPVRFLFSSSPRSFAAANAYRQPGCRGQSAWRGGGRRRGLWEKARARGAPGTAATVVLLTTETKLTDGGKTWSTRGGRGRRRAGLPPGVHGGGRSRAWRGRARATERYKRTFTVVVGGGRSARTCRSLRLRAADVEDKDVREGSGGA